MKDLPVGTKLSDYPIDEMLVSLAKGIVRAQLELDKESKAALLEAKKITVEVSPGISKNLLELGFFPTFLKFETVEIEMGVELSMAVEEETSIGVGVSVGVEKGPVAIAASIDIAHSRKYGVSMTGSTRVLAVISSREPPENLVAAFQ